ncbi:flagellar protein FlgN [bacterium LRH843]|nr:flagellar protein FlgN [bacterium LRH843]
MSVKAILDCMENLVTVHEELAQIGKEKVEPIKKGDMSALSALVRAEAKLVRKAQTTEIMREKLVASLLADKGKAKENATMRDVKEVATAPERERLDQLQEQLLVHMNNLKRINEQNQLLLEESLRFVNLSLDLMVPHQDDVSYKRPQFLEDDQDHPMQGHSLFDSKA